MGLKTTWMINKHVLGKPLGSYDSDNPIKKLKQINLKETKQKHIMKTSLQ